MVPNPNAQYIDKMMLLVCYCPKLILLIFQTLMQLVNYILWHHFFVWRLDIGHHDTCNFFKRQKAAFIIIKLSYIVIAVVYPTHAVNCYRGRTITLHTRTNYHILKRFYMSIHLNCSFLYQHVLLLNIKGCIMKSIQIQISHHLLKASG